MLISNPVSTPQCHFILKMAVINKSKKAKTLFWHLTYNSAERIGYNSIKMTNYYSFAVDKHHKHSYKMLSSKSQANKYNTKSQTHFKNLEET